MRSAVGDGGVGLAVEGVCVEGVCWVSLELIQFQDHECSRLWRTLILSPGVIIASITLNSIYFLAEPSPPPCPFFAFARAREASLSPP